MHAAVVRSFDHPPRYESVDPPTPRAGEMVVDVLAAGLHPRVRSGAAGRHYTSTGELPLVPGVDGVGRLPDGTRVWFLAPDATHGTMAEQAAVDPRRCLRIPDGVDDATVAAAVNPALSSWLALRSRADLRPGQRVLVLGATGNAGQLAVQVARRLGAGRVVAAGRDPVRLAALTDRGADAVVSLDGPPGGVAAALTAAAVDVDVVVDYLWGRPAETAMAAVLAGRSSPDRPLTWVQVGSTAGPTIALESALLRSNAVRITGSGQGSVSVADILAELPSLLAELATGALAVDAHAVPLADVEAAWDRPTAPGERIVLVP